MSEVKDAKYNPAIDLLRIISILSVILIHTTTKALDIAKHDLLGHPLTLFLNQATRFTVPLFFLISAFVLELNYPPNFNYFSYLKKRFSRLFLPYFFWSIIYYFFIYTQHSKNFIFTLLSGDASYQLYFIPTISIFYLIFPLLHHYFSFFTSKLSIVLFGFFQIIILAVDYYYRPLPFFQPLSIFILNFDIFILGILASRHQKNILDFVKKYYLFFVGISVILAIYIFWEGQSLYLKTNNYLFFYSQWRPSVFIYTLFISSLLFFIFNKIKLNSGLIKKLASYSFFVYFVHIIFLEIICKYLPNSIFSFPLIPFFLISFSSYLLAFLVSKFPLLSKITS